MPLNPTKPEQKQREVVPAGNHFARIYRVIQLGTNPETYLGESKMINKVMIGLELPTETRIFSPSKGSEPFVISVEYTLSMGEKANLRKFIEGLLGVAFQQEEADAFDVFSLIGQACMLNVIHKTAKTSGRIYPQIKGASPVPKGMTDYPAYNPVQKLSFSEWNTDFFMTLPTFIREKISSSTEYRKMNNMPYPTDQINPDDIPF